MKTAQKTKIIFLSEEEYKELNTAYDTAVIGKIQWLTNLLEVRVPDNKWNGSGEIQKELTGLTSEEAQKVKNKIMELIELL